MRRHPGGYVIIVAVAMAMACGGNSKGPAKPKPAAWSPFDAKLTKLIESWLAGKPDAATLEATRAHFAAHTWDRVQVDERKGVEERVFVNNKDASSVVETAAMSWDRKRIPKALGLQLRGVGIDKMRQWLLELAPRYGGRYFDPDRDTYVNEKKPATALLPKATVQVRRNEKGALMFVVGLRRYPDEMLIDIAPSRFSEVRNRWQEPRLRADERERLFVELDKRTALAGDKSPTGMANPTWRVAANAVAFIMYAPGLYGAELAETSAALNALPKGSWNAAVSKHLHALIREAGCAKHVAAALAQPKNTQAAHLATKCDWRGKRSLGPDVGKLKLWQVMLLAAVDHLADRRNVADWPLHKRIRRSLLTPAASE